MQVSPPAVKLQNTLMASPVQPWFGSIQYSPGRRKQVRYTATGLEWGQLCPSCYWMPKKGFCSCTSFQFAIKRMKIKLLCEQTWWFKVPRNFKNTSFMEELYCNSESRFSLWTSQKPAIKTGSLLVLCLIYVKNNSLQDYRSKVQSFVFKGCSHLGLHF